MKKLIGLILTIIIIIGSVGLYADNAVQYNDLKVSGKDHWAGPYLDQAEWLGLTDVLHYSSLCR